MNLRPALRTLLLSVLALSGCESCASAPLGTPTRVDLYGPEVPPSLDRIRVGFSLERDAFPANVVAVGTARVEIRERVPGTREGAGPVLCAASQPFPVEGFVHEHSGDWTGTFDAAFDHPCPAPEEGATEVAREVVFRFEYAEGSVTSIVDAPPPLATIADRVSIDQIERRAVDAVSPDILALREAARSFGALATVVAPEPLPSNCGSIEAGRTALMTRGMATRLVSGNVDSDACRPQSASHAIFVASDSLADDVAVTAVAARAGLEALGPYTWLLETTECVPPSTEPGDRYSMGEFGGRLLLVDRRSGAVLCGADVTAESAGETDVRVGHAGEDLREDFASRIERALAAARRSLGADALVFANEPAEP